MNTQKLVLAAAVIVGMVALGFFWLNAHLYNKKQGDSTVFTDLRDSAFIVSDEWVYLKNGVSSVPTENSASVQTVQYFGNEARGDIDGDGDEDAVFLITKNDGGSGTFFFLVGALADGDSYRGTHAVFIGDRIAPQTTEVKDGRVIVNYADRAPGEPFTTAPSVGKSVYLRYSPDSNDFGELVQNFEGESDREVVFSKTTAWRWKYTERADGTRIEPVQDTFVLSLTPDGSLSSVTDCNSLSGSYVRDGEVFSVGPLAMTKKYCEGSQEQVYAEHLGIASSVVLVKDELHINLYRGYGTMVFTREAL